MKAEYLLFNLFVLFSSTLGISLYPKRVIPKIKAALSAILSVGLIYIIWDHLVTGRWWWFNQNFTLGVYVGNLPIEELLFFISVPWSCLILWVNLKRIIKNKKLASIETYTILLGIIMITTGSVWQLWYTMTVGMSLIAVSIGSKLTNHWLNQKLSVIYLFIVLGLTLIFNGYLTSRPIVIYDLVYASKIKIYTIPIEDILYGLGMLSFVTMFYEKWSFDSQKHRLKKSKI